MVNKKRRVQATRRFTVDQQVNQLFAVAALALAFAFFAGSSR
jgi:hypothetical protein